MESALFQNQKSTPHMPADPFKTMPAPISRGDPFKNSRKNHLSFAESNTRSADVNEFDPPVENQPVETEPVAAERVPVEAERVDLSVIKQGEYHPSYCAALLEWFDKPKMKRIVDSYTWKSGAVSEKERFVPNTPPHFSEFARSIGVSTRTLKKWASVHPEFKEAMESAQEILEEFLIDNGLIGAYGAISMKFVAVNKTKMKDKVVQENQMIDMNKVLDKIANGEVKPGGQMLLDGGEEF